MRFLQFWMWAIITMNMLPFVLNFCIKVVSYCVSTLGFMFFIVEQAQVSQGKFIGKPFSFPCLSFMCRVGLAHGPKRTCR